MARSFRLAIALCLAGCVNLSRPPQLMRGDLDAAEEDGGDPENPAPLDGRPDAPATGDAPSERAAPDGGSAPDDARKADEPAPLPVKLTNGTPCTAGAQCQSTFCVDSVCCDSSCVSRCTACDVAGTLGACKPVPAGQDPDNECDQEAASTCGRDGTCDGQGDCRRYPAGFQCMPGGCTGATERAAGTCSGTGVCQPGATRSCSPNLCQGSTCASQCAGPADCQTGFFCEAGKCMLKRAAGMACSIAEQCGTGFCIDGVCCSSSCGQLCYACNLAGNLGMCTAVPDGPDRGDGDCPADAPATCMRAGGCNGRGACRLYPPGTVCGAPSCASGVATSAGTCNGGGVCSPGSLRDCGVFACNGAACATSCTSMAECKATYVCNANTCVPGPKIASLTVHDTARASMWAVEQNFQIGQAGAHPWTDYPATYVVSLDTAAQILLGDEWIRVSANSKNYTGGPQATITLNSTADIYMMVDDRWGSSPGFTSGWTNTGWNMVVFESSSRPSLGFSLFRKTGVTGSISLPQIGSNNQYNYFIVVD
jgi:hypothetical protein